MNALPAAQRRTPRLFFALWPDEGLRARIAALASAIAALAHGRAVAASNVHMTLAFLGDTPIEKIEGLAALAASLPLRAFTLVLDTTGGFRRSGIAWLGASQTPAPLAAIHAALSAGLTRLCLPVDERPFHPHVTLARRCTAGVPRAATEPIAWQVRTLSLVESVPGRERSEYRDVASWTLAEPDA